jgi:hypothetical protein
VQFLEKFGQVGITLIPTVPLKYVVEICLIRV